MYQVPPTHPNPLKKHTFPVLFANTHKFFFLSFRAFFQIFPCPHTHTPHTHHTHTTHNSLLKLSLFFNCLFTDSFNIFSNTSQHNTITWTKTHKHTEYIYIKNETFLSKSPNQEPKNNTNVCFTSPPHTTHTQQTLIWIKYSIYLHIIHIYV